MTRQGANTEGLFEVECDLARMRTELSGLLASDHSFLARLEAAWSGPDATAFVNEWLGESRPALVKTADDADAMEKTLRRNRLDQEHTSGLGSGQVRAWGSRQ